EAFNEVAAQSGRAQLSLVGGASLFPYAVVKVFHRDPHWAALKPFYGATALRRALAFRAEPGPRYIAALKKLQTPAAAAATRFCGEQSRNSVAALVRDADIVAIPSVCDEPFGIPAVEAMAAQVAVVAAAAGGLKEIVRDGETGLLVPRSDAHAMADAILRL